MVQFTNLNKRTNLRDERSINADKRREKVDGGFLGPYPTKPNRFSANESQFFKAFKNNPDQKGFYEDRMFLDEDAANRQEFLNILSETTNNNFDPGNQEFANAFVRKYAAAFRLEGDPLTGDEKGLLGPVDPETGSSGNAVTPETIGQLASRPAASANAIVDSNTAGKFPSNEVRV